MMRKMSNPSHVQRSSSTTPVENLGDDASRTRSTPLFVGFILGFLRLAAVAILVYLTYFCTTTFAHRTTPAAPLSREQTALAKKAEDLRFEGSKVLSSYGWVDPVTKSKVRIPIDRAMELLLAESARPLAPATALLGPVTSATKLGTGAATTPATSSAAPAIAAVPSPSSAPAGTPPEQMYRLVCMACHDTDGKGKVVRLAMPPIPDFTDPKFHSSHTDAELSHSILEGKESTVGAVKIQLMLSMKDKLALARTDVKDMVAFIRAFKGGKQVVSATSSGSTALATDMAQVPVPSSPTAPAPSPHTRPIVGTGSAPSTTTSRPADFVANALPMSPSLPSPASTTTTEPAAPPTLIQATAAPAATAPPIRSVAALPTALPVAHMNTAARAEKLRMAGGIFSALCIACHGPDGRGTLVRPAMPPIPDFTSRDWQTSRSSSQLASSILEGKGTLMPTWNGKLTPEQARNLVLYVRSFGGPAVLAAETEGEAPAALSLVEFDNRIRSLRLQFDEIEKQLQTLPAAASR
jgi:mono/diheme cytochrome c family protein